MAELALAIVEGDERAAAMLDRAGDRLAASGHEVHAVSIAKDLPELSAGDRATWESFKHTPDALLEAWSVARQIETLTEPGTTVVMADDGGRGGVLALAESARPDGQRRALWTIAADSNYLRWLAVAGTIAGIPEEVAAAIDWEIVQYRFSKQVLSMSEFADRRVADLGVAVEPLSLASPETTRPPRPGPASGTVWLPEPVSRRSRTGTILRALSSSDLDIVLSVRDEPDLIWQDTTWDALAGVRALLGDRITRAVRPDAPDWLVLGDLTALPAEEAASARSAGARVVVPASSTAAALWPEAATWQDEDDLAAILGGSATGPPTFDPVETVAQRNEAPNRARRVAVGIPVFRDVRFLDEAVESILAQTQAPHEVLLIDDGSNSAEVDESFQRWAQRVPVVRTLHQANRGVCSARNRLLEAMTGDAFVLLDADDVLEPTFIERTATALRDDHRMWAVSTWTRFDGEYDGIEAKPPFDTRVGLRENPIVSTGALVDMTVRDRGIRFAPDLAFLYCEDWHFWSQVVAAGGAFGLVPEPLVRHRTHRASGAYQRTPLALAVGKARATAPLARDPFRR